MWTHVGFQTLSFLVLRLIPSLTISVSNSQMPARSNYISWLQVFSGLRSKTGIPFRDEVVFHQGTLLTRDWIKNKKSCFL